MEPNKTLFSVIKTDTYKLKIILNNVLTMLGNRIYIDKNDNKQALLNPTDALKKIEDRGDGTYTIRANNGDNFAIKIVFQKISATGKQSVVSEFFKEYAQYKKIIIARDFNNKIADYVSKHHTQIFKEATLLDNIIDYRDQPRFELLSPREMEAFKAEYNATDYTTKKILRSDPIAKYYALRKGDIIRIIRPSPTSGEAIDYRIVL
jgi:DNA-directed RNA polymerase subunit H (RpoH/RPB5)